LEDISKTARSNAAMVERLVDHVMRSQPVASGATTLHSLPVPEDSSSSDGTTCLKKSRAKKVGRFKSPAQSTSRKNTLELEFRVRFFSKMDVVHNRIT